jgi:hypothetical protein
MTDLSLEERRNRANRAKAALDDLGWAFESYEDKLTEGWKQSNFDQAEHREVIWHRLRTLKGLKDGLVSFINDYEDEQVLHDARERNRTD